MSVASSVVKSFAEQKHKEGKGGVTFPASPELCLSGDDSALIGGCRPRTLGWQGEKAKENLLIQESLTKNHLPLSGWGSSKKGFLPQGGQVFL